MFIVRKLYEGEEFSRIENPHPSDILRLVAEGLASISLEPRFSLHVEVQPVCVPSSISLLSS